MNYPQWKKSDWSETRFGVTMKDEYIGPLDPEREYSYFTTVMIKRK